jgi:hypothetical protein
MDSAPVEMDLVKFREKSRMGSFRELASSVPYNHVMVVMISRTGHNRGRMGVSRCERKWK